MRLNEEQIKNLKPLSEHNITEEPFRKRVVVIDKTEDYYLEVGLLTDAVTFDDDYDMQVNFPDGFGFFKPYQLALLPEEPKQKSGLDEWPVGTDVINPEGCVGKVIAHNHSISVSWSGGKWERYEKEDVIQFGIQKFSDETITIPELGKTYKKTDVIKALSELEEIKE